MTAHAGVPYDKLAFFWGDQIGFDLSDGRLIAFQSCLSQDMAPKRRDTGEEVGEMEGFQSFFTKDVLPKIADGRYPLLTGS